MKRLIILLIPLFLPSCGDDNPLGPSGFPQVAGDYSGSTTMQFPEVQLSITCPTTTRVTQTGGNVSIAPLVLTGQCDNLSLPIGDATIDSNGSLGSETGTFFEPSCGGNYNYTASGGFFGRELRLSVAATSSTCLNFNLTTTLTR